MPEDTEGAVPCASPAADDKTTDEKAALGEAVAMAATLPAAYPAPALDAPEAPETAASPASGAGEGKVAEAKGQAATDGERGEHGSPSPLPTRRSSRVAIAPAGDPREASAKGDHDSEESRDIFMDEDGESDESYMPMDKEENDTGWGNSPSEDDSVDLPPLVRSPEMLERGGSAWRPIYSAMLEGDAEAVGKLLELSPHVLRQSDVLGRSPLHLALIRGLPDMVKILLSVSDSAVLEHALNSPYTHGNASSYGIPTLHLAMSAAPFEKTAANALRCAQLLLAQPRLRVNDVDCTGRTALHLACAQGSASVLDVLLEHKADPGVRDDLGNYPLHYAIDSRNRSCVDKMLSASDQSLFSGELHPLWRCIDRQGWEAAILVYRRGWSLSEADINRIFDLAASRGLASEWNFVVEKGMEHSVPLDGLQWPEIFSPVSTVVVTHTACLEHGALPHEVDDLSLRQRLVTQTPENPLRLEVLCGERGVLRSDGFHELRWVNEPAPAPLVDVLRVHEYWYVHKVLERISIVKDHADEKPLARIPVDRGDTEVTRESWSAALRAAGCVLESVDLVCNEQVRNAFCAVRPPGHHMGPAGACDRRDLDHNEGGSQGFCLLNNVAIGAAYARCVYRHIIHKVAIIDFDVHHGNGTEAVVRHIKAKSDKSTPKEATTTLHGFSVNLSLISPPSCKPWLDPGTDVDNVFFASIHAYGAGFYPSTGATCNESSPKIINVALRQRTGSVEFRDGMRTQILPELLAFDPDIIFISAGFDGHEEDLIGDCKLVDEDYTWATQQLIAVANRCCQGRLVSVLEGGYNTRAETLSPFAHSVSAHVRALMHTSPNYSHLEAASRPVQPSAQPTVQPPLEPTSQPEDERLRAFRDKDQIWTNRREDAKIARGRRRRAESLDEDGPSLKLARLSALAAEDDESAIFGDDPVREPAASSVAEAAEQATTGSPAPAGLPVPAASPAVASSPMPAASPVGSPVGSPASLPDASGEAEGAQEVADDPA